MVDIEEFQAGSGISSLAPPGLEVVVRGGHVGTSGGRGYGLTLGA